MDNIKNNEYFLKKMIVDLEFIVKHTKNLSIDEFKNDEILQDSVMFRLIQVSENSDRLKDDFKARHSTIAWRAIKGMRNRIVHDYGEVDITVVYDTVANDIPDLLEQLLSLI